eukprot:TRINITY_DN60388_c0_g1_i1.p2 TRINITY_DN60388_c0_g1~~TRINITY_DN60388_c0_g1_i1.p2  ORF type:complete len:170 (-),score=9.21 TRINITY_DN60388_c0_g1_i1:285-794(-)
MLHTLYQENWKTTLHGCLSQRLGRKYYVSMPNRMIMMTTTDAIQLTKANTISTDPNLSPCMEEVDTESWKFGGESSEVLDLGQQRNVGLPAALASPQGKALGHQECDDAHHWAKKEPTQQSQDAVSFAVCSSRSIMSALGSFHQMQFLSIKLLQCIFVWFLLNHQNVHA